MLVRYGTALIAVLLVLLLAVRPLIGKLRGKGDRAVSADGPAIDDADDRTPMLTAQGSGAAMGDLPQQVELARRLAVSQPERAVEALQRMLEAPAPANPEASAS
jgi:flagellar M-ring protein FliF